MTKYIITKIKLDKIKILEVYNELLQMISYDKVFFEVTNLSDEIIKNKFWADNQMQEFIYSRNLNYDWDPDKYINVASNLNNLWEWENTNNCQSLTKVQAEAFIKFMDRLRFRDYDTALAVLDNIKWSDATVKEATYGYKKVKSNFGFGENYLSNAIIICKGALEKNFMFVCREAQYEDNPLIQNILNMWGKKTETEIYYAPSDEQERAEFKERTEVAEKSFWVMANNVTDMYRNGNLPYPFGGFNPDVRNSWLEGIDGGFKGKIDMNMFAKPEDAINVKKIAKKILEPSGWKLAKKGFKFEKEHKDAKIILEFDSLHKGHKLAILITYYNEKFHLYTNLGFSCRLADEEAVEQYCIDVRYMMKYVESVLE